jgi:hypothetical protein
MKNVVMKSMSDSLQGTSCTTNKSSKEIRKNKVLTLPYILSIASTACIFSCATAQFHLLQKLLTSIVPAVQPINPKVFLLEQVSQKMR